MLYVEKKGQVVTNRNDALCVSAVTPVSREDGVNRCPGGLQKGMEV